FLLAFAVVPVWWRHIPASNDRDWQPEVARLAYANVDGDRVTIHNIRNFDYRSETDFTPGWYDATFDVSQLQSVDLIAAYWMGDAIAHIFVSFGFADGRHVAFSVETRKERGESYSTLAGFFKQYELYYVVADERDVIRVRTNYRQPHENVFLYRAEVPPEHVRGLFLYYIRTRTALKHPPRFYNTPTPTCTTAVLVPTRVTPGPAPSRWKVLLSGYTPQYAYERGRLDTSLPFDELRR